MALDITNPLDETRFYLNDTGTPPVYNDATITNYLLLSSPVAKAANDFTQGVPIYAAALALDIAAVSAAPDAIVEQLAIIKTDGRNAPQALTFMADRLRQLAKTLGLVDAANGVSVTPSFEAFPRQDVNGVVAERNMPLETFGQYVNGVWTPYAYPGVYGDC